MNSRPDFSLGANAVINLGLERVGSLLRFLDNPHRRLRFVHVAGTNGKGSVCAFLCSILEKAGLRTGKYLSPELLSENERISIDGRNISEASLGDLLAEIRPWLDAVQRECAAPPSPFEIWTAAAFLYFARNHCDIVVCEAGLGGRLDATNIIPPPLLTVITRIAKDHARFLGPTLQAIAGEKAGIIKDGSEALTLRQHPLAMGALKARRPSIHVAERPCALSALRCRTSFTYKGMKLSPSLLGVYQAENACLAAEAALLLQKHLPSLTEGHIQEGIASAVHPGRFQPMGEGLIFDGAHNPNGCAALARNLNLCFPREKIHIIFAVMKDKALAPMLRSFKKWPITFTSIPENPRALPAETLRHRALRLGIGGKACPNLAEALEQSPRDALRVVCGSLYLYAELMKIIKNL